MATFPLAWTSATVRSWMTLDCRTSCIAAALPPAAAGSRPADLREPGVGLAALGLGVDDGEVQGADLLGDHAAVVADEHFGLLAVIGDSLLFALNTRLERRQLLRQPLAGAP